MDPVSVTLAVFPLVGGALKTYKLVRSKLKTFCHYSSDVERVIKLFSGQRDYFLNEVELLLRLVLQSPPTVKAMMRDTEYAEWQDVALEGKLEEKLGRSFEPFRNLMEDIGDVTNGLEEALWCFSPLQEEYDWSLQRKTLKEAMRKLRKRVKITSEKEELKQHLSVLEKSNDRLRRLLEQVNELQKPQPEPGRPRRGLVGAHQLPADFRKVGAIRRASVSLHDALLTSWSGASKTQLSHSVCLFLGADGQDDVQMQVVILCNDVRISQTVILQRRLIPLNIRSKTLNSIHWKAETEARMVDMESGPSRSPFPSSGCRRHERRKVRFAGLKDDESEILNDPTLHENDEPVKDVELRPAGRLSGHFCTGLNRHAVNTSPYDMDSCLGHLENQDCAGEALQHWLYLNKNLTNVRADGVVLMEEALGRPIHNRLTIVGQLRLALQLASAVLKFNSTPWMNELWTTRDVAFFRQGDDLHSSLRTLHLSRELGNGGPVQGALTDVDTSGSPGLIEEARFRFGVRNVMLYSLGVALLSVGRWEKVDPGDVEAVRGLASLPCSLGPRYRELTEKVIDCDFGQGKDLRKPKLQEAVYETVVMELKAMICALDLGCD